jgi:hypothetical protein
MYSGTIQGILVSFVGLLISWLVPDYDVASLNLPVVIGGLMEIGGLIYAYVARQSRNDVTPLGRYTNYAGTNETGRWD